MSWEYRIIKTKSGYAIHEVYYNKKGEIKHWTDAVSPSGATLCELNDDFDWYKLAFEKPVLIVKGDKLY